MYKFIIEQSATAKNAETFGKIVRDALEKRIQKLNVAAETVWNKDDLLKSVQNQQRRCLCCGQLRSEDVLSGDVCNFCK